MKMYSSLFPCIVTSSILFCSCGTGFTPEIITILSDESIILGESLYDNVSFTGLKGIIPTVNISFQYWDGAVWVEFDNQTLQLVNGADNLWTAHSDDFKPDKAGNQKLRAYYPGDDNYCINASADEPFTVIKQICAYIRICKQTTPDCDPAIFTFTRDWGDQCNRFTLSDHQCQGFWVLAPGTYMVQELYKPGWILDKIVISGVCGPNPSKIDGYNVTINIDPGETITVTEYGVGTDVARIRYSGFSIDSSTPAHPRLVRTYLDNNANLTSDIVADDIEDMQVLLGVYDNTTAAITEHDGSYFTGANASKLASVRQIRIQLVGRVASPDPAWNEGPYYNARYNRTGGITGYDHHRRRPIEQIIYLRNTGARQ